MQNNDIFKKINIMNVINQLNLKKTKQIGYDIFVICPFCQVDSEKRGKLKANIQKNVFYCNNCEASGTSIDLYSKFKFISKKEAYKQLLKKAPILDNVPYMFNNPIKDEAYRDIVYRKFLELQNLSKKHKSKLMDLGFGLEDIEKYKFKSIENIEYKKKEICEKLQEQGFNLDGISGFFQDTDFKWTYKSYEGIFIPVFLDNKIQGLRIFLDDKFDDGTESIWFSSNNKYNGAKANNWPILLKEDNVSWTKLYNSKKSNTLIIATEILAAYKLFNEFGNLVLGIPNNINKELLWEIISRMRVKEVTIYVDTYTMKHTSNLVFKNVISFLEEKNIKVHFKLDLEYSKLNKKQEKKKIA